MGLQTKMIQLFILGAITLIISLLLHEFAHYIYSRYGLNQKTSWRWAHVIMYPERKLTKRERIYFLLVGIAAGMIPIAASVLFIRDNLMSVIYLSCMLIIYGMGCGSDIKKIKLIMRTHGTD